MSSGAFQVAAIGMGTQQRALDAIANNIANVNTTAFKRSEVRFADVVVASADRVATPADVSRPADQLAGVALDTLFMVNEQGPVERTGNAMDLAIEGAGFIELIGPGGQTMLWRGGGLTVGADGLLSAANGMALKAGITVPEDATGLTIAADGSVTAKLGDATTPVEIGQIRLVKIVDTGATRRLDGGLYRLADGEALSDAVPGEDGHGALVQGALERSNVQLTDEMVRMMLVQRAYAANAQIAQAADQMMSIANGLRR
ncbi:flagellar hook basal-body protein [uncultured Sphingomonas sp.]|uniref:flagellar hook-basal body protein n=1 Tax=uncultured Sphingomonas sp. TaxID=158754 RepID=UPI0025E626FD|nr:flagellar hook basal-body protein [uncultured Sphingomonas sp.]